MDTPTPDRTQEVYDVLKYIIDPEIGVNIVDLGLVYDVQLTDQEIHVEMTLTTPGCPMSNTITMATEQILLRKFPHRQVTVELVWTPAWTPERISAEGLEQL